MKNILIRPYSEEDDEASVRSILALAMFDSAREMLDRVLERYREGCFYLAYSQEELIGCIGFDPETGEILHLAVKEVFRRRGVGGKLLHFVYKRVVPPLVTAQVDELCVPFFEACGFTCEKMGDGRYHCFRVVSKRGCC